MGNGSHFLALADGSIFYGKSAGAAADQVGEVVFNTGMTGYQEIISDPSYAGQIVTLTTAEVGNYGCNAEDGESRRLFLHGLITQNINPPSNFRSTVALDKMLADHNVPTLTGVDTRRLTLILRSAGTMKAYLHCADTELPPAEAIAKARQWCGLDGQDYASKVSIDKSYEWNAAGDFHIVAFDFGIKLNILRELAAENLRITVVPAWTTANEVLARQPAGVFFSNGPADPSAVTSAITAAKELCRRLPVMGICLGHQIIALAHGAQCGRLKFGHHGCNHPVKDLSTGEVAITSQNHNFAITEMPPELEITHLNLNDNTIEGLRHRHAPVFSVQYHPEAAPGPHDARNLFRRFRKILEAETKTGARYPQMTN